MNDGLFLVARVAPDSLGDSLEWLGSDEPPFQAMDRLDFLSSAEVMAINDLYRTQYLRLDARLNIRTPEALLEYQAEVTLAQPHTSTSRALRHPRTWQCSPLLWPHGERWSTS